MSQPRLASANVISFSCTGLDPATKYYFQIRAYNDIGNSGYSSEADATTGEALPVVEVPAAPTELAATAISGTEVSLVWKDNSSNETGFKVECKPEGGEYVEIGAVEADVATVTHPGLAPATKYYYRIKAYNASGDSDYSNEVNTSTLAESIQGTKVKLNIGSSAYGVNGEVRQMDVAPIIIEGRTLLPARYIAEALGATVEWVGAEQKVVITRGTIVIEMWLNNPGARVNGVDQNIDPNNANVSPISVPPGRTMTPGRFIAENLGAIVGWDPATQEVTITYTPVPTP